MPRVRWILAAVCLGLSAGPPLGSTVQARQVALSIDDPAVLLLHLEHAMASGAPEACLAAIDPAADRATASGFADAFCQAGVTRAVLKERDRGAIPGLMPGAGQRLLVEAFVERGDEAALSTIQLDVRRAVGAGPSDPAGGWRIASQSVVSSLPGLYRLSIDTERQYEAAGLRVIAEDLVVTMARGAVFVARTPSGPTALVLVGDGQMQFRPDVPAERTQVRIFSGSETLVAPFSAAFVRVNPASLAAHLAGGGLVPRTGGVNRKAFERAAGIFRADMPKSYLLDLGDLSSAPWSLMPADADFLAEIHTTRHGTLTYARSSNVAEDVHLFDRQKRKQIAIYASREVRERRGRFYDEDELATYQVRHLDLDASFWPNALRMQATARLSVQIGLTPQVALLVRLADSLAVRSITSERYGRLLSVRVRGQNTVVVSLPEPVAAGSELDLTVTYAGPIEPQPIDREAIGFDGQGDPSGQDPTLEPFEVPVENSYLFSNRSHWYPHSSAAGYATATLRLAVPAGFASAASGVLAAEPVDALAGRVSTAQRVSLFRATRPARYFSWLVTRLVAVGQETVEASAPALAPARFGPGPNQVVLVAGGKPATVTAAPWPVAAHHVRLSVEANPRQQRRGREVLERAGDILKYYGSLMGDFPYPSAACALVEGLVPGGHSPAYLAVLGQQVPGSTRRWRDDPAAFPEFRDFFLAHELAHQWWGQAVGWKNYHEQWLSEGLAQYFAMLYADASVGPDLSGRMLRQFSRWAIKASAEGPVYLGYRIGHLKGDSRLFRAVVYNKGAAVLHMLRRLVGDEAFFRGLRRFYGEWRFRKAGTDDLRAAFEAESGVSLDRFFERWIYNAELPQLGFSWRVEPAGSAASGGDVVLRFEQAGDLFDLPVTATIVMRDGERRHIVVPVRDRVTEMRAPVSGAVDRVEANRDELAVAVVRQ